MLQYPKESNQMPLRKSLLGSLIANLFLSEYPLNHK